MNDPDRTYALLLQKQLDLEGAKKFEDDLQLALDLQDEFNHEFKADNPSELVYEHKKTHKNDSRSLVDPSWELVDPTPNIHNLFVVFNQRYFWNKLLSVCVSWSKRMTSCAGICSYQGRGGMCSITISEPLLKLRPRKDLVETLLHEMIHAYLFVTHNNKDREGHGPEFHKHMYRINKEAGTNITVHHTFHDEVRLYQQHWWRCNGPCQNRKPFFGMVRRAMNRAPGSYDRWWGEHQRTCSGTFIKIREPEKVKTTRSQPAITTISKGEAKKYVTSPNNISSNTANGKLVKAPKKSLNTNRNQDITNFIVVSPNKNLNDPRNASNNMTTINNRNGDSPQVAAVFNKENIHGFKNLGNNNNVRRNLNDTKFNPFNSEISNSGVRTKSNNSNTVVVTGKTNMKPNCNSTNNRVESFPGSGRVLSANVADNLDYSTVRNHWLNKFDNTDNKVTAIKRPSDGDLNGNIKKSKISETIEIPNDDYEDNSTACPVCNKIFRVVSLNEHLDKCLLEKNVSDNSERFCNNFEDIPFNDLEECPVCNVNFNKSDVEEHIRTCIETAFNNNLETPKDAKVTECTVCLEFIENENFAKHVEQCLHKMMDDLEKKHNIEKTNDDEVPCLVCGKKILKSELNIHLDDCMSDVFDDKNNVQEGIRKGIDQPSCSKDFDHGHTEENKFNCPFCMEMYSELDMSAHLDDCLQTNSDENKSLLIDSICSDEF